MPSARRNAASERAVQTRMLVGYERALEAHVARLLRTLGRQAADAHRNGESITPALDRYRAGLHHAMRATLISCGRDFANRLVTASKAAGVWEAKAFEDLDAAIARHLAEHAAEAVVGISDHTREVIAHTIAEGVTANLGQEEVAAAIVEATAGEIGMARARRIARTEMHFAAMYAQQAAAEASPLAFEKEWLATEDSRTRQHHADAHGQRVGLNDVFVVGDVTMRYPGDTLAPPGEVINCRCVCLYDPLPYGKDTAEPDVSAPGDSDAPDLAEPSPVEIVPEPEFVDIEPVAERDIEAAPYEREEVVAYAAADLLPLQPDGVPRTGSTVNLIGPADLFVSPDAPEVDRQIASGVGGFFSRRPVLWRITIPAGPEFPGSLVEQAAAGITINSGVGEFGLVPLTITAVRKTTWGEAAPKSFIDPDDLSPNVRWAIQQAIDDLDQPGGMTAQEHANAIGTQILGVRRLAEPVDGVPSGDIDLGAPDSVLAALRDVRWTKRALRVYLERLMAGELQDEPGQGEPATDARVIVVEATADLGAAVPEGYQDRSQ